MKDTKKKKNNNPASNFQEPDTSKDLKGNKVVKDIEDKIYTEKEFKSSYSDISKAKENGEQPVHPIKKTPKK